MQGSKYSHLISYLSDQDVIIEKEAMGFFFSLNYIELGNAKFWSKWLMAMLLL